MWFPQKICFEKKTKKTKKIMQKCLTWGGGGDWYNKTSKKGKLSTVCAQFDIFLKAQCLQKLKVFYIQLCETLNANFVDCKPNGLIVWCDNKSA